MFHRPGYVFFYDDGNAVECRAFFIQHRQSQNLPYLVTICLLNSVAFLLATVAHIEALKYVAAGIAYTVIQLNVVVVVIFSVLYFNDRITGAQSAGLLVAVLSMMILARQMHQEGAPASGGGGAFFLSAWRFSVVRRPALPPNSQPCTPINWLLSRYPISWGWWGPCGSTRPCPPATWMAPGKKRPLSSGY